MNVLSELRFTGTMFKVATLVPFERNLIDLTLLNRKEVSIYSKNQNNNKLLHFHIPFTEKVAK